MVVQVRVYIYIYIYGKIVFLYTVLIFETKCLLYSELKRTKDDLAHLISNKLNPFHYNKKVYHATVSFLRRYPMIRTLWCSSAAQDLRPEGFSKLCYLTAWSLCLAVEGLECTPGCLTTGTTNVALPSTWTPP